ncbi:hypothetical protein TKK_0000528 [Trichogramma kaykai]|uniref:Polynucleotide 5'-hydroxyl-kinase NOL9 n=1 Tax=Trichogramma kaykai TaxID=54128 RepID=A0ABD2WJQ9_9HYME
MKVKSNNKRKRSDSSSQKQGSSNDPDKYVAFKLKKMRGIDKKEQPGKSSSAKKKGTTISSKISSSGVVGKPVLYQKPEMDVEIIDGVEIRTPKNYNLSSPSKEPTKSINNTRKPTKTNSAIFPDIGKPLIIEAHLKKSTKSYYPSFFSTPSQFLESDPCLGEGGLEYQMLQQIANSGCKTEEELVQCFMQNLDVVSKKQTKQNSNNSSQEMQKFYQECNELSRSPTKKCCENKCKKRNNNTTEKADESAEKKCHDVTNTKLNESVSKKSDENAIEKSASETITSNLNDSIIESVEQMPRTPKLNAVENKPIYNSQNNRIHFFCLKDKVVVIMRPCTQFTFLGKLKLKVLYGVVGLYGAKCDKKNTEYPVEIYSPKGYGSISIYNEDSKKSDSDNADIKKSNSENPSTPEDKEYMWNILTTEGVDRNLTTPLHEMLEECDKEWSVILLENLENTLTKFLNVYFPFKLFPKVDLVKYSWTDFRRAEFVLQSNLNLSKSDEMSIGSFWSTEIQSKFMCESESGITDSGEPEQVQPEQTCIMVTGGKGVGKSTTVRYLINSYLQKSDKVILLDLDPGQAEMTYPGCVSLSIIEEPLLGPNFTHLKHPYYQHCLDEVNVSNCIPRYINYVKKLVDCLRNSKELSNYPIVVNTMGFCKGIGLDLCLLTIKFVQPTCVIQLESKKPKNNYDYKLTSDYVNEVKTLSICWNDASVAQVLQRNCKYHYFVVQSRAEGKRVFETWNMEPRQQRELNMLSYFSKIVDDRHNKSYCSLSSETINNIVPYEVPFDSVCIALNKSVSPTHALAAINGSVVALCGLDREQIKHTSDEQRYNSKSSRDYPQYVVNAAPSMCYGFGIVRGVDMERLCFYVNTPLNEAELRHVNLLLGCQEIPLPFLRALAMGDTDGPVPYMGPPGVTPMSRAVRRGQFRVDLNASKKG